MIFVIIFFIFMENILLFDIITAILLSICIIVWRGVRVAYGVALEKL